MNRRWLLGLFTVAVAAPGVFAQAPVDSRPVRVLVGFTPGGSADLAARAVTDGMGRPSAGRSSSRTAPARAA